MSRTKELVRSIGSTLASQSAMTVVSIAFFAYFGRMLPKSEMAVFAFMGTLTSWVELISGLGLATLAVREVPKLMASGQREEASRLISSTLVYSMSVAVLFDLCLFFFAPYLSGAVYGSRAYTVEFRILAIVALAQSFSQKFSLMQWALQRFHIIALCGTVGTLSCRVLAVGAYLAFGIRGFLLSFGLGELLVIAIHYWSMRRELTPRILPSLGLLRHSRTYIATEVLRNLFQNLDRPVVAFFLGDVALADYYVAKRVYDFLAQASLNVAAPVGAKLSELKEMGKAALSKYFHKAMYLMAILFVPAGCAIMIMGEAVLRIVVGAKYGTGGLIMTCFGIAIMLQGISQIWRESVYRLLAPRFLLTYNMLLAAVTFAMYAVLLPRVGPSGIPLAFAAAYLATSVFAAYLLRRDLDVTGRLDVYIRPAICGLLVLLAARTVSGLGDSVPALVGRACAAVAAYVLGFMILAPPEASSLMRQVSHRLLRRGRACESGFKARDGEGVQRLST